jgi:hypothetical protein
MDDVLASAKTGFRNGVAESLTLPAKAAVGLTGAVADRFGASPQVLEDLAGKVDGLDQVLKGTTQPDGSAGQPTYVPQTKQGEYASALAGGVGGALIGPQAGTLLRLGTGAASGAGAELASNVFRSSPETAGAAALAASVLPGVLTAGREIALPDHATLAVQKATTAQPGALDAALARMQAARTTQQVPTPNGGAPIPVPAIPILPGQAFGPDHQMAGIQGQVARDPIAGPALQAFLANQKDNLIPAATSTGLNPDGPPIAPYRSVYNAAAATPVQPMQALSLSLALRRAAAKTNPVGATLDNANAVATLPMNGVSGRPMTNLGQVQSIGTTELPKSGLPDQVQAPMARVVSGFLRTQDGRFAAADDAFQQTQAKVDAARIGQEALGAPATSTAGTQSNAAAAVAGAGAFGGLGVLAVRPLIGALTRARQIQTLGQIMSDPSGKSLQTAAAYSPAANSADELYRAWLQSQIAAQSGSAQGKQ